MTTFYAEAWNCTSCWLCTSFLTENLQDCLFSQQSLAFTMCIILAYFVLLILLFQARNKTFAFNLLAAYIKLSLGNIVTVVTIANWSSETPKAAIINASIAFVRNSTCSLRAPCHTTPKATFCCNNPCTCNKRPLWWDCFTIFSQV